jgi:uncharacterized protein with von Willebrand factor type A (vWA) domain
MSFSHSSSSDSAPLHIILCLDESCSMKSYWDSLVDAVMQFFAIRKTCASADKDLISVIKFASEASLLWDKVTVDYATTNRSALSFNGGLTEFIPALDMVNQQMLSEPAGLGVVVVFMTDGETDKPDEAAPAVGRLQDGFGGSSFPVFRGVLPRGRCSGE